MIYQKLMSQYLKHEIGYFYLFHSWWMFHSVHSNL